MFTREQLDAILRVAHPRHQAMLRLLAGTGLRWGEVAALRRGDLSLDGSRPVVRVRRTLGKPTRRDRAEARNRFFSTALGITSAVISVVTIIILSNNSNPN